MADDPKAVLDPEPDPSLVNPDDDKGAGDDDKGGDDKPFLTVNDRTSFKTAEDAVKSFGESGERIATLSQWERLKDEFGVETVEEARELLNELVDRRAREKAAGDRDQDPGKPAAKPADDPSSGLSDEDKKAVAYFKRLGVPISGDMDGLRKQIDELKTSIQSGQESDNERHASAMIESGRSVLTEFVKGADLLGDDQKVNQKLTARAERAIRSYLEDTSIDEKTGDVRPGSPLARFYRGGNAQREVVKEAFEDFLETFTHGKSRGVAGYEKDKQDAKNPKPLPKGASAADVGVGADRKPESMVDTHNKAWGIFERKLAEK